MFLQVITIASSILNGINYTVELYRVIYKLQISCLCPINLVSTIGRTKLRHSYFDQSFLLKSGQ